MSRGSLLVVERMVLEALGRSGLSKVEICKQTGLKLNLVSAIVSNLFLEKIITRDGDGYIINKDKWSMVASEINSSSSVKEELKDLFVSLVNQFFVERNSVKEPQLNLSVKKIWLNSFEEKLLNAHLINLKEFIENVEKDKKYKKNQRKLSEKKVIIWGISPYDSLVKGTLQSIC